MRKLGNVFLNPMLRELTPRSPILSSAWGKTLMRVTGLGSGGILKFGPTWPGRALLAWIPWPKVSSKPFRNPSPPNLGEPSPVSMRGSSEMT